MRTIRSAFAHARQACVLCTYLTLGLALFGPAARAQYYRGVALAGPEFSEEVIPGELGVHYSFNSEQSFAYFSGLRLNLIRIPVKWERLQPLLFGPLNQRYLGMLHLNINWARAHGARVIIDIHNYGRYTIEDKGALLTYVIDNSYDGEVRVPRGALANLWSRLSERFQYDETVYAYGLMNEPHDMGKADWKVISQAVVDAIRERGDGKLLMIAGDSWSSADRWRKVHGPDDWIDDPRENVAYEAHVYFDHNASGRYDRSFDDELVANPNLLSIGVDRLAAFIEWCADNQVRGYLGEYGVPADEPRWLEVLDRFMMALDRAEMDATYWAAGEFWGDYSLSVQPGPAFDQDPPQLAVLRRHLGVEHVTLVSAASFTRDFAAPGSLVSAFGVDLADRQRVADGLPLPTGLGDTRIVITDVLGREFQTQLVFVSPSQANFLVPLEVALGVAEAAVWKSATLIARGDLLISRLAPALFSANGNGVGPPAALLTRVASDGSQSVEVLSILDSDVGGFVSRPLVFAPGDRLFLSLFGTGFRNASATGAAVEVGGVSQQLLFLGAQQEFPGLDQVNMELSPGLAGGGDVDVVLKVEGRESNRLSLILP